MRKIYLDYAASTPVDPEVLEAMVPYFSKTYGNPGSLHSFGQEAIAAVDLSRETIAKTIGADFREIVFTGSATEANNLALRSVVSNIKGQMSNVRILVSAIEHESVLETARDLEQEGIDVVYLPVDREGFIDLKKLESALNERTVLVSVMYANNEIGTIQPIVEISKIIRDFRESKVKSQMSDVATAYPLLHSDAVQAFQYLGCDVKKLGLDLMTLSAHKIYGPKGIGVLYVRQVSNEANKLTKLKAIITGGGQEFGLRSGTENVPAIVGFAKAIELALEKIAEEVKRVSRLRDYFWKKLKGVYPSAELNGCQLLGVRCQALPNILNIYFPNNLAEDLLIKFDMAGVVVSSGSACRARSTQPSYVLEAIGLSPERVKRSIRFSFGRLTTKSEVDEAMKRIKLII